MATTPLSPRAAARIARDANRERNFAGDIQLVYDAYGRRVACFPGGNVYVRQAVDWQPGMIVLRAGNGRSFAAEYVLAEAEDEAE